ncbi:MAG: EAL domain-containing response regulator [Rhodospirillales bacterium]
MIENIATQEQCVLVVDDDEAVAQFVADVIEQIGGNGVVAHTFAEFQERAANHPIDAIMLDLSMPDQDGVEYLRHLQERDYQGSIALMSGFDNRVLNTVERFGKSLGLNIIGTVQKPIEVDVLEAIIYEASPAIGARRTSNRTASEVTEKHLAHAIEARELFLEYQPKVVLNRSTEFSKTHPSVKLDLLDRIVSVESLEALVRWHHPVMGRVGPDKFIPLAEETGLIEGLTAFVVEEVIRQATTWQKAGMWAAIGINYPPHLITDIDIPDRLASLADEAGIARERLILEITESAAMTDTSNSMDVLSRLRLKGMNLSIDDFGTGFSSLIQLYRMPFSELKIDQSLVFDMGKNEEADVIVRSTIDMAHGLGLMVCAEGVETPEVAASLEQMGCDVVQGYYYSKPMSGDDVLAAFTKANQRQGGAD